MIGQNLFWFKLTGVSWVLFKNFFLAKVSQIGRNDVLAGWSIETRTGKVRNFALRKFILE